jgi:membrane protease YdiL (CAAX protease family)
MKFLFDKQFIAAIIVAIFVWVIMSLLGAYSPQNFNPFYVILFYPITEEIVFRGTLQDYFCKKFKGNFLIFSYGNIITSIIFSSLHLFYQPVFWALLIIAPSLIFGYFKDKFNSVIPAVVLHIFYNFGYFYLLNIL